MSDEKAAESARARRLRMLRREKSGALERAALEKIFKEVGLRDWEFLSLERSDEIQEKISATIGRLRTVNKLRASVDLDGDAFTNVVDRELHLLLRSSAELIAALSNAQKTGMLEVQSRIDGVIAKKLLDSDQDSMTIVVPDLGGGLVLQRFEESRGVRYQVEGWSTPDPA